MFTSAIVQELSVCQIIKKKVLKRIVPKHELVNLNTALDRRNSMNHHDNNILYRFFKQRKICDKKHLALGHHK